MRPNFNGKASKWDKSMGTFYDMKAVDIDGKEMDFEQFEGKAILIVNVASN